MPKTKTPVAVSSDEFDIDGLMDTVRTHSREFTIGGIVVVALASGLLLWRLSSLQKDDRAEHALTEASMALGAGNRPLASNELQTLADRYRDTAAGVEGGMILAQLDFEDEKWDDGLKILAAVQGSSAIKNFGPEIDGLVAGALSDQKKFDEAAARYLSAADKSPYQAAKDSYSADAARVLALAGKKDQARKIWEGLAARSDSPMTAEAKVRLGELDATAVGKN
jgi:predicted negative regulator of RcsB-dependent stress response